MEANGHIFANLKIWVAQRVPMRTHFVNQIKENGGTLEFLEKNADIRIADHARKEQLPGTHSYTFIEESIRRGTLANLNEHRIGPAEGLPRIVGSVAQPAKGSRTKYTAAEDRILWEWVNSHPQKGGGTDGNEIYKQLEAKHPQHPWQSWRDRFIKKLKGRPPPSTILENGPPTPPLDAPVNLTQDDRPNNRSDTKLGGRPFSEGDAQALLHAGDYIESIPLDKLDEAWESFATSDRSEQGGAGHSPKSWQKFWEDIIRPQYRALNAEQVVAGVNSGPESDEDISTGSTSDNIPYIDAREHLRDRSSPVNTRHALPMPTSESRHNETPLLDHNQRNRQRSESLEMPLGTGDRTRLKRKRQEQQGILPRETMTAKQIAHSQLEEDIARQEIPSTPDKGPAKKRRQSFSPLFVEDDEDVEIKEEREDSDQDGPSERWESGQESEPYARAMLHSLAQMDRQRAGTQDLFRDRSPSLDLGVAPPEGGWEPERERAASPEIKAETEVEVPDLDYDAGGEASDLDPEDVDLDAYLDDEEDLRPVRSTIPETQHFYSEATPMPDLDVVEPEGGFEAFATPHSPERIPSSQQDDADDKSSNSDYTAQMDVFIANADAKGFPEDITLMVLRSTSLDTELAKKALEHMGKGKRRSNGDDDWQLPSNWRGVWTETDDEAITAVDGRVIERLIKKHGTQSYDSRRQFLALMRGQ